MYIGSHSLFAAYWKALFSILGKLYSIGILSTLNGRQKLRNLLSATTTIDFEALNSHRRSTATRTSLPTTIIFKPRCEAPNHIEMNRGTEIVTDSIPDTPAVRYRFTLSFNF
ncbi:hypothetical protein AN958_03623 [Leucoagaricus sp. SymC.cos]|nr:hypothetical protein AN958_03623 [Leucoagaricus sp. SymC.cos]